jgi:hypothetical protein
MENTAAAREKGWWKTALLALYIKPGVLDLRDEGFQWVDGWQDSFAAVAGRVLVAPLLSVLLLNRHPRQVRFQRHHTITTPHSPRSPTHSPHSLPLSNALHLAVAEASNQERLQPSL